MDCSLQDSSVRGILQARTLEGVAISSSRGSSPTRDEPASPALAGEFLTIPLVLQEHPAHRSRTECRAEPSSARRPGGKGGSPVFLAPRSPGRPSAPHPSRQRPATARTPGFPSGSGLCRDNRPLPGCRPLGLRSREAGALPPGSEKGAPEAASKLRRSHRPTSGQRPSAPPRTAISVS